MEDSMIVELYWKRDEAAIAETHRQYGQKLMGVAGNILRNHEDSQECVSDTYWKTWETIPPRQPSHFFAYLAKICRHLAFGRLDWNNAAKRKAQVVELTREMELCIPDESREQMLSGKEITRAMNCFLEGLNPESRLIFLRRYWFCDSIAEIAQQYHFSQSKVKTRLHRLRAQLRDYLQQEGIDV